MKAHAGDGVATTTFVVEFTRIAHHHPDPFNIEVPDATAAKLRDSIRTAVKLITDGILTGLDYSIDLAITNPRAKTERHGHGSINGGQFGSFTFTEGEPTSPVALIDKGTK